MASLTVLDIENRKMNFSQGAEAKLYRCMFYGQLCLIKERFKKKYRHVVLDYALTKHRIKSEVKAMLKCRINGIRTPTIFMVDMEHSSIYMEYIDPSITVKDYIANIQSSSEDKGCLLKLAQKLGQLIGKSHGCNVIHGDLTSSNMLLTKKAIDHNEQEKDVDMLHTDISKLDIVLIDFGLASLDGTAEDKAVDLYVLERALLSTHSHVEYVFKEILTSYYNQNPDEASQVIKKLDEVRLRGRKRTMVG